MLDFRIVGPMNYLYLDESGDLGYDFRKRGTSRYFVITILVVPDLKTRKAIDRAVKRTIKYKLRKRRSKRSSSATELKGALTAAGIKSYFYKLIAEQPFSIYSVTLDRSKGKPGMAEFNEYLEDQLQGRIPLHIPLDIHHDYSYQNKLVQGSGFVCLENFLYRMTKNQ